MKYISVALCTRVQHHLTGVIVQQKELPGEYLTGSPHDFNTSYISAAYTGNSGFTNFFNFVVSFASHSNCKIHGTSSPPCGKSMEYLLCPVT